MDSMIVWTRIDSRSIYTLPNLHHWLCRDWFWEPVSPSQPLLTPTQHTEQLQLLSHSGQCSWLPLLYQHPTYSYTSDSSGTSGYCCWVKCFSYGPIGNIGNVISFNHWVYTLFVVFAGSVSLYFIQIPHPSLPSVLTCLCDAPMSLH